MAIDRGGAATARIAGYVLVVAFFSLGATANGLKITFHDAQTTSSPGELNFWLGHAFLLFPAALLRQAVTRVLLLASRVRRTSNVQAR